MKKRLLPGMILCLLAALTGCAAYSGDGEIQAPMVDKSPLVLYVSLTGEEEQLAEEISSLTGGRKIDLQTETEINPDTCETIYIGSFLQNGEILPMVKTFLKEQDFSTKTVIPFGVTESAQEDRKEKIPGQLQEMCPESRVLEGFFPEKGKGWEQKEMLAWLSKNGQVIPIKILAGEEEVEGVLFGNPVSREFSGLLPIEVPLYQPANFAKAFNLSEPMTDPGSRTRLFEKGGLAYWPEGPAVAVFFSDHVDRTVVPVYTLGKLLERAELFEEYEGTIRIERAE